MPRPNRKKKTPGHARNASNSTIVYTKRQEIQDEDGWTHVVDAPRKRRSTLTKAANGGLHTGDFEINGVGYVNRTAEEMRKEYEFWKKSWEGESACETLGELLEEVETGKGEETVKKVVDGSTRTDDAPAHLEESAPKNSSGEGANGQGGQRQTVDNIIVLGLGSLQSARREGRRATMTQLAALQTIVQHLEKESQPFKVTLQEPNFTPLDIEYLESFANFKVVNDPDAFGTITTKSLVYAVHCYSQVYKAISEGARPAVLIGTDMSNFGRFNTSENAADTQKCLEALVDGCEVLEFPQVRHDFSDTKIYWRRVTEDITS